MRGFWAGSLGLSLGLLFGNARADEIRWRSANARPAAPAATLGRPVAAPTTNPGSDPIVDRDIVPAGYGQAAGESPTITRAQNPEYSGPTLAPPGMGGAPGLPAERYNCGVVTDPPGAEPGFWSRCRDWCGDFSSGERCLFQSDRCFNGFISPMSNPFLFEDPRSLTEARPIFMYQHTPRNQYIYRGGDIEYFGIQGRLAFTERLSLVMNKFGWIWSEPHNHILGFDSHVGFSELWLGPKYTIVRNDQTNTLFASGLTFQIPAGPGKVFQDTGSLSLNPYFSFAQSFLETSYGKFNFMNTTGYAFGTDRRRTDYLYSSLHLDFDVLRMNKIYPLVEMNWFNYAQAGNARTLGFEGRDLFNFGSTGVSGHNDLSIAVGARYKFVEAVQTGFAVELPLVGTRDLLDYRLTFDLIFRY